MGMATTNERPHRSEDATESTEMRRNPDHTISYRTWGRSRSLRLKDFDYASPGVAYHITIGTDHKQNNLTNPNINRQIVNNLKSSADSYGYTLIAYCLMPDHLHFLVQAGDSPRDLRGFVRGFKSYCSTATRSTATPMATRMNRPITFAPAFLTRFIKARCVSPERTTSSTTRMLSFLEKLYLGI